MTDAELDRMERLWRWGVSARGIALVMGCTPQTVRDVAHDHRERFPYRYRHADPEQMAEWVGRCLRGEATQRQAAEALGVTENAVGHHVRKERANERVSHDSASTHAG